MKIKCQREALLAACQLVGQAVAARTTKPILANIKAVAHDDALTLMGTDLEIGIRYELRGVDVVRAGAVILPVSKLVSILRESADEEVHFDANDNGTTIRTSTGKFVLPGGEPGDFPDVPAFDDGGKYHEITAGVLRTMIKRTAFAADKKESGARWAVTGVLWETDGNRARLVATDTKRLAMSDGEATVHGAEKDAKSESHLVPRRAIELLERSLTDDGEIIRVALKKNEAMFQTERATVYTKLVEGRFPPYKDIIPKKSAVKVAINTADLLSRVRQAAIMSDAETKRVDFKFEAGKATLKAQGAETGSSEVTLLLPEHTDQREVEIAFDPSYLTEMLRAIDGETGLTLEMTDGGKPAIFRLAETYLYLVMPLSG